MSKTIESKQNYSTLKFILFITIFIATTIIMLGSMFLWNKQLSYFNQNVSYVTETTENQPYIYSLFSDQLNNCMHKNHLHIVNNNFTSYVKKCNNKMLKTLENYNHTTDYLFIKNKMEKFILLTNKKTRDMHLENVNEMSVSYILGAFNFN